MAYKRFNFFLLAEANITTKGCLQTQANLQINICYDDK